MKNTFSVVKDSLMSVFTSKYFWYFVLGLLGVWIVRKILTKIGILTPTLNDAEAFINTPLPNNGKGIPDKWTADAIVENFHDFFDSWFNTGGSDDLVVAYKQAAVLTDDQFVALCKVYNAKYAKKDGSTLYTRVKSWKAIWFGANKTDQDRFIERMIRLKQNY